MTYPICQRQLVWSGDFDAEDADGRSLIEGEYHCPHCDADITITTHAD